MSDSQDQATTNENEEYDSLLDGTPSNVAKL